jgi:peptidoglycan/LPS O-acetylase OafA/YrhL
MTSVTSVPATEPLRAPLTRLPSLTGLRWIAAFLVFGFHVGTLNLIEPDRWHRAWDSVFGLGASGVSFFFVLSGFVLAWSARPGDTLLGFWRRRIAKIYPNHVAMFIIVMLVMLAWGDRITDLKPVLANLFLVQTWPWADGYAYTVNSVSWTLCCELFFYLCLPFVLPVVRRIPTGWLYGLLAALVLVILLINNPLSAIIPGAGLDNVFPIHQFVPEHYRWWFDQLFPPVRSLEFWTGVLAGVLLTRRQWFGPGLWISTAIFVALYVACTLWIPGNYHVGVLTVAYAILIGGAAKTDLSGAPSPWRWPVMVWLGEVSFAFYLVHVALIANVLRLLERNGEGWNPVPAAGVIILAASGSLFAAWLLFTLVEKPMMRILGPRRRPRPEATPPTADEVTEPTAEAAEVEEPAADGTAGSKADREPDPAGTTAADRDRTVAP